LNGCSSAEPFYVLSDNINVKYLFKSTPDTVQITLPIKKPPHLI